MFLFGVGRAYANQLETPGMITSTGERHSARQTHQQGSSGRTSAVQIAPGICEKGTCDIQQNDQVVSDLVVSDLAVSDGTIEYQIARTQDERMAASRLVYQQYSDSGLITPNQYKAHITPAHLNDATTVIVGQRKGQVICTVSLVGDGDDGLPMENIYRDEIARRRNAGLAVAEVSCLAITNVPLSRFLPTLIGMTRLMAQHARNRGIDQLLIAAHPKHAKFYERFMGFERFGPLKDYPQVRNHPAVASCLDFDTIDRDRPRCWDQYFRRPIPAYQLCPRAISPSERDLYRHLIELVQVPEQRCLVTG